MPFPRLSLERTEPWVAATARQFGDHLLIEIRSERDLLRAAVDRDWGDVGFRLSPSLVRKAGRLSSIEEVRAAFDAWTQRQWPRLESSPLFIDPQAPWPGSQPGDEFHTWWEAALAGLSPKGQPPGRCQVVALPRERGWWRARRAPTLPFVVRAIGPELRSWIEPMSYLEGFALEERPVEATSSGRRAHVLVLRSEEARLVLRGLRKPFPSLVLCVADAPPELDWWIDALPRRSSAVIHLPGAVAPDDWARDLLYALTHDLPVHEAAFQANRRTFGDLVLADPVSNHDLRLVRVLDRQRSVEERLAVLPSPGDAARFVARAREEQRRRPDTVAVPIEPLPTPDETANLLLGLSGSETVGGEFENALEGAALGRVMFVAESGGLEPLFQAQRAARSAEDFAEVLESRMAAIPDRQWIEAHQERRVNLALERRLEDLLAGGDEAMGRGLLVDPEWALAPRRTYRLRLRIGRPFVVRLYTDDEEPPPIDPTLPPAKGEAGHELEVAVFGLDFQVSRTAVQTLRLPAVGTSEAVGFEVETPDRPGPARLRVCIFHENNLVQSFLVHAEVAAGDEEWRDGPVLRQELEFSRTRRFTGLQDFGSRAVSIGVNDSGATHSFMVKTDGKARDLAIPQALLQQEIDRFRTTVAQVSDKDGSLRFTEARLGSEEANAEFDDAIRQLARSGREIYRRLSKESRAMKTMLRAVRDSNGLALQVIRYDLGFAFPWAGVYDFRLPRQIHGDDPAPVCRGGRSGHPCEHGPGDSVYCVRGFWGVRHRIEQLMGKDTSGRPPADQVRTRASCLALGVIDRYTNQLKQALPGAVDLTSRDDVLDALWDVGGPGIVVLLGHVEQEDIVGQPTGVRLVIAPSGPARWLQDTDVFDRADDDDSITAPAPLVLLLGCGTASADTRTLNDLFSELIDAGVAGVVGTECLTFVEPAAGFASFLIKALRNGATLGESVRAFREDLARRGSPLGFTFTAFGNADLRF